MLLGVAGLGLAARRRTRPSAAIETGVSNESVRARRPSADTKAIAVAMLAAIQGGLLLAKTARNSEPLELAFDMALGHIERFAASKP